VYKYKCPRCKTVEETVLKLHFNVPKNSFRDHLLCKPCLKKGHKITLKYERVRCKLKSSGKWSDNL
jgi:hypothetical protein